MDLAQRMTLPLQALIPSSTHLFVAIYERAEIPEAVLSCYIDTAGTFRVRRVDASMDAGSRLRRW